MKKANQFWEYIINPKVLIGILSTTGVWAYQQHQLNQKEEIEIIKENSYLKAKDEIRKEYSGSLSELADAKIKLAICTGN